MGFLLFVILCRFSRTRVDCALLSFLLPQELPEGKWFCSPDCSRIHSALQSLLAHGPEQLPSLQSDLIKRKHEQKSVGEVNDLDIRWRLLSGKAASPDSRLLLAKALSIFHVSFSSASKIYVCHSTSLPEAWDSSAIF